MDQAKSWLKENSTLAAFLIAQVLAIGAAAAAMIAYSVKLETRVHIMETRGAEYTVANSAKSTNASRKWKSKSATTRRRSSASSVSTSKRCRGNKMKNMAFEETSMLDASTDLRETQDGYLIARPRIARTGIQIYRGAEVGRPDMAEVRVYRPESEVMSKNSMRSLAHKPVTIEHPDEPITARTWKDLAVGQLGEDIVRDGEFIRVPMMVMDANAIDIVRSGKKQLSVGYTAVLQWGDGKTPDGESYNAIQTAIRANHVAITHTARGGDKLRMGDHRKKEKAMRTILVDGISLEMEDRDAQVVERRMATLQKDVADAQTALATAKTQAQTDLATAQTATVNANATVATKDAEIATLKAQLVDAKLTPAKLDEMVSERVKTVQKSKALIGDALVTDGKTDADMRKQVVLAKLGDTAKDWNEDMIRASFNTLAVTTADGGHTGLPHIVNVIKHNDNFGGVNTVEAAYAEYDKALTERWKTAGVRSPH